MGPANRLVFCRVLADIMRSTAGGPDHTDVWFSGEPVLLRKLTQLVKVPSFAYGYDVDMRVDTPLEMVDPYSTSRGPTLD